jgi:xylan 1,4-beta-xylosidase
VTFAENADAQLDNKPYGDSASFQRIEALSSELVLMSLRSNRFLRIDLLTRCIVADSPTPLADNSDGTRLLLSLTKNSVRHGGEQ